MALLNSKNCYIKLTQSGRYEIYASEEARKKVKKSTSGETILAKYLELINDLDKQAEYRCYDPEGFYAKYVPLDQEYLRYKHNFVKHIVGQEYPIMAEIYPDVADSIPEIVEAGTIKVSGKDLEDVYLNIKQLARFGETSDV